MWSNSWVAGRKELDLVASEINTSQFEDTADVLSDRFLLLAAAERDFIEL